MAISARVEFGGLSTDTKPVVMPGTGYAIPAGSTFVCTDTLDVFVWSGANWFLRGAVPLEAYTKALAERTDETNRLLRKLIRGLEFNLQNGEFPDED